MAPHHARLHAARGWAVGNNDHDKWIQADLQSTRMVLAIVTQGVSYEDDESEWVTEYSLSHSNDGITWIDIDGIFVGNWDGSSIQRNELDIPTMTRYVRLYVVEHYWWPSLRWGIEGYPIPPVSGDSIFLV